MVDYLDPLVFSEATKKSHKAFEKMLLVLFGLLRIEKQDQIGLVLQEKKLYLQINSFQASVGMNGTK